MSNPVYETRAAIGPAPRRSPRVERSKLRHLDLHSPFLGMATPDVLQSPDELLLQSPIGDAPRAGEAPELRVDLSRVGSVRDVGRLGSFERHFADGCLSLFCLISPPGENAKSRGLSIEKKIEFLESLTGAVSEYIE